MTVDSNHLRGLRKATRHVIGCQQEAPCALHSNVALMCDYCRFHFECYRSLPKLLDRSDALTEALQLLRATVEVCQETVAAPEQGADLCADLGQELEGFLARHPQGGT